MKHRYFESGAQNRAPSRSAGFIVPHSAPPEQIAGNQEQNRGKGEESVPDFLPSAQHIEERVILHQCERDDESQNPQHAFPINVHRVLAMFVQAESEDIGEFQPR